MTRYKRLPVAVCLQNVTARWCSYPATVEGAAAGPEVPDRIQAAPGRATGGVTRRRGEVTASDVAAGRASPGLPAADDEGEPDGQAAAGSAGALEEALGAVIAERVREFRLHLGLTVGQLAELTSLSKGMLSIST